MLGLTFVVQVAFSGSTNLSSLWTTAAGHNLETLVSIMKVSIWKTRNVSGMNG